MLVFFPIKNGIKSTRECDESRGLGRHCRKFLTNADYTETPAASHPVSADIRTKYEVLE